jgi:ubiquinone biosynthesis protein
VLSPETVEAIGRSEAKRWRWATLALWVIAGLIAVWLLR